MSESPTPPTATAGGPGRQGRPDVTAGEVGVVLMAYGTPAGPGDVEAFYTDVRRGRAPTAEQLDDLRRRYDAIGGVSPLSERTRAQIAGVQGSLDALSPGRFRVTLGNKHSPPRIEDAVDALAAAGVAGVVGLVLAPHYSALSVGEYGARLAASGSAAGVPTTLIESWHEMPVLLELLAARVLVAIEALDSRSAAQDHAGGNVEVLFTAHSLPSRVLATGDPYPRQLEETAAAVAALAGIAHWRTAWQSAGRTAEPWLGPDLLEVLASLPGEGFDRVVVCPAGFTSDHLEVLYDVDIEARRVAEEHHLDLERTASLNDDPRLCEALAALIVAASGG